jgi:hypothetical protein
MPHAEHLHMSSSSLRLAKHWMTASACPHEVEDADQTSGFVDREYDEPEVANVRDSPSRHSGRRAEHRIVRVVADPGQQRHEHIERVLRKAGQVPPGGVDETEHPGLHEVRCDSMRVTRRPDLHAEMRAFTYAYLCTDRNTHSRFRRRGPSAEVLPDVAPRDYHLRGGFRSRRVWGACIVFTVLIVSLAG